MKMLRAFSSLGLAFVYLPAHAENLNWFDGKTIDYWNEGNKDKDVIGNDLYPEDKNSENTDLPVTESIIRSGDFLKFDWKNYEDPKNPQFWDDGGNYVPPRPLRVLAASPTKENLEKYMAWQNKKMVLMDNISRLLSLGSLNVQDKPAISQGTHHVLSSGGDAVEVSRSAVIPWNKVHISFFYKSSCPYCRKEVSTIEKLKRKGVSISSYQINAGKESPLLKDSKQVSERELKELDISSTPTMIVTANKKSRRFTGYVPIEEIENEIIKIFN